MEEFAKNAAVPCYKLEKADGEPAPLDSSIGGIPYCPAGQELPKDEAGDDIPLLIQINFEGVSRPGYPDKGIFQIFMDYNDFPEEGVNCTRYYEDVSAECRKDVKPSNHNLQDAIKSNLKKAGLCFHTQRLAESAAMSR